MQWYGDVAAWSGERWASIPRQDNAGYGRSLAASPDGHVFLEAGDGVAEWTGERWVRHELAGWDSELDAQVIAPSTSEVYIVGRGSVARGGSGGFKVYSGGTWRSLSAVALVGQDLWVGGQGGTVMQLHAGAWTRLDTRSERWIRRLVVIGAQDVWALADGEQWNRSTLLHWDGLKWERRDEGLPQDRPVQGLGGTSEALYAVGEFGAMRWAAGKWTPEITAAALGDGLRGLDEVCATDRQIVVIDRSGTALVRSRGGGP